MNPYAILLVDDEPVFVRAAAKVLSRAGYEVATAHALAPALELLNRRFFDAVITDLSLVGTRGTEGLDIARLAKRRDANVRVILVTAYGNDEVTQRAGECGVDIKLDKPVSLILLKQVLADLGVSTFSENHEGLAGTPVLKPPESN